MKQSQTQLHSLFEHLVRSKAKVTRQMWLDINVEGICNIELSDKQKQAINRRFGFIVQASTTSINLI